MKRLFSVSTEAADKQLLTLAELRAVAGLEIGDTSLDDSLTEMGLAISESIARFCGVKADGIKIPSLLQETCVETIYEPPCDSEILLSRRFVTVSSVVADDVTLSASDYFTSSAAGSITRLYSGNLALWQADKIVVTYVAGFQSAPSQLKECARAMARLSYSSDSRDPLLKSVEIPGVARRDYVIASPDSDAIPNEIQLALAPFVNTIFA